MALNFVSSFEEYNRKMGQYHTRGQTVESHLVSLLEEPLSKPPGQLNLTESKYIHVFCVPFSFKLYHGGGHSSPVSVSYA